MAIRIVDNKGIADTEAELDGYVIDDGVVIYCIDTKNTFISNDRHFIEYLGKINQTEINFGTTPLAQKTFTINDSNVYSNSKILAQIAYDAPTGKDLDEIEMDNIIVRCGNCTNGTFDIIVSSTDGSYLSDKFKINYIIN